MIEGLDPASADTPPAGGVFVTGTDTEVGKTVVAGGGDPGPAAARGGGGGHEAGGLRLPPHR